MGLGAVQAMVKDKYKSILGLFPSVVSLILVHIKSVRHIGAGSRIYSDFTTIVIFRLATTNVCMDFLSFENKKIIVQT